MALPQSNTIHTAPAYLAGGVGYQPPPPPQIPYAGYPQMPTSYMPSYIPQPTATVQFGYPGIHQPTPLPPQYPPYPAQYGAQIPPPMPQYPVQQQNQVLAVPEADNSDTESTDNSSEEDEDTSEPESANQEDFGQYVLSFN